jgi:hypothetical protein
LLYLVTVGSVYWHVSLGACANYLLFNVDESFSIFGGFVEIAVRFCW